MDDADALGAGVPDAADADGPSLDFDLPPGVHLVDAA